MADYIRRLIEGGESQTLDFKFEVSDFSKIARTLVAFSNTDGGRLLLGVKDNGAIAGVRSEEEYFMIEGAANLYCKPAIPFEIREWQVEGRKVLEVIIQQGLKKPYLARDEEGKWIAYVRQGDENFKASKLHLQFWRRCNSEDITTIRFRHAEKALLAHLEAHDGITQSKFRRIAGLTSEQSEKILIDFMMLDLIGMEYKSGGIIFSLNPDYRQILDDSDRIFYPI